MTPELSNPQRRKLKALAQKLEPLLRVGKNGLSEPFLQSLRDAFHHHELIKIRFDEMKERRKELAPEIAARTSSHLVWIVGHVAVFFREHPDPARRGIRF